MTMAFFLATVLQEAVTGDCPNYFYEINTPWLKD